MGIKEYFDNYRGNKTYNGILSNGVAKTINDLFDDLIVENISDKKNILEWHNMLMRYIEMPEAVLWVRYHESGNKRSGLWNNRRGSVTRFKDGFSYVFVSNYDVHEIFNMISKNIVPSEHEFLELMKQ